MLESPWPIREILFVSPDVGWAAGGNIYSSAGGIYYSGDGGATWTLDLDSAGNLYGTTLEGGVNTNCYGENIGCGTVFELSPAAGGGWTETILHDFNFNGTDGVNPSGTLIFDAAGNLYGTTLFGGANGFGTVFEVAPGGTERVLYSFDSAANGTDGFLPYAGLIKDESGDLYGTTYGGGADGGGGVFKITQR